MRSRFPLFSAAAAALLLAACGSTSTAGGSGSQTVSLKIMVGGLNKQIYLPNMLAQRLGYFSEQHLNVTLIDEGTGQASEDEVVAGGVQAGSGAYVHPMVLNTQGKKIETICQFGIAPGEAEVVDASLTNVTSPAPGCSRRRYSAARASTRTTRTTLAWGLATRSSPPSSRRRSRPG